MTVIVATVTETGKAIKKVLIEIGDRSQLNIIDLWVSVSLV
jgi:hypothetical protein